MSTINILRCDRCGKELKTGSGPDAPRYDPDAYNGWLRLDVSFWDSERGWDFCSIECVAAFTAGKTREDIFEQVTGYGVRTDETLDDGEGE